MVNVLRLRDYRIVNGCILMLVQSSKECLLEWTMNIENIENLCINCMEEKSTLDGVCEHCGFDVTRYEVKVHQLEPFTILHGRYLLGRVLGEGGFGITYAALDLVNMEKIAIKELFVSGLLVRERSRTVLVDSNFEKRDYYKECKRKFIQEAELLQKMSDKQGVVDIYDFFEENDTAYIVMEYLPGEDVLTILKNCGGRISFTEAFQLLRPVLKSLIEMHSIGIYHRDISPDNIRRLPNGKIKIFDLGGAKYTINSIVSQYVTLKHGYAPPEQYATGFKIGPWMDVYAMAATFYRCVCGKVPKASIDRRSDDDIEKPSQLGVELSSEAERVILKGMALQSEERYIDMREFYLALKNTPEIRAILPNGMSELVSPSENESYNDLIVRLNLDAVKKSERIHTIAAILVVAAVIGLIILLCIIQ